MNELEMMKAMFARTNTAFTIQNRGDKDFPTYEVPEAAAIQLTCQNTNNDIYGYHGFIGCFVFDKDGKFLYVGYYE